MEHVSNKNANCGPHLSCKAHMELTWLTTPTPAFPRRLIGLTQPPAATISLPPLPLPSLEWPQMPELFHSFPPWFSEPSPGKQPNFHLSVGSYHSDQQRFSFIFLFLFYSASQNTQHSTRTQCTHTTHMHRHPNGRILYPETLYLANILLCTMYVQTHTWGRQAAAPDSHDPSSGHCTLCNQPAGLYA